MCDYAEGSSISAPKFSQREVRADVNGHKGHELSKEDCQRGGENGDDDDDGDGGDGGDDCFPHPPLTHPRHKHVGRPGQHHQECGWHHSYSGGSVG